MQGIKKTIEKLLYKGSHGSLWYLWFDYFIMLLILLNVVAVFYESFPSSKSHSDLLNGFELFSVIVFTIEYALRLFIADRTHTKSPKFLSYLFFITRPLPLIDLFSILPFYLPLFISQDLRFLRIFRLFRFLRVIKIKRYIEPLDLILSVFKEKRNELVVTFTLALLLLVSASATIFYMENPKQPENFTTMIDAFWWSIDSMTPVSFEKKIPITNAGKAIGSILGLFGVALVALPAGIISAGFLQKLHLQKNKKTKEKTCPHCGKKI